MKTPLILGFLFLFNLVCLGQNYGDLISEGKIKNVSYKIYSHHDAFETFYNKATKDSIQDYKLWESVIYEPTKGYWDIEFKKENDVDVEQQKWKLYKFHSQILEHKEILDWTQQFEKEAENVTKKTLQFYGDEIDDISILIIPVAWQGGTVKPLTNNSSIMPIGVNRLKTVKIFKSVLPHEYTHRYNQLKGGFPKAYSIWKKDAKMYWSLWSEGLATYGTGEALNDFSSLTLLMHKPYENFPNSLKDSENLDPWLAKQFLKIYRKPLLNYKDDVIRSSWFASNSSALRSDLPPAIGYYLGYKVVKFSIEELGYTFEELISLKPRELKKIGLKALRKMKKHL